MRLSSGARTSISGEATLQRTVKSNGFSLLSLLAKDTVPSMGDPRAVAVHVRLKVVDVPAAIAVEAKAPAVKKAASKAPAKKAAAAKAPAKKAAAAKAPAKKAPA